MIGNVTNNNTEKPADSPNDLELDKSPLGSENLQTQKNVAEAEKRHLEERRCSKTATRAKAPKVRSKKETILAKFKRNSPDKT